MKKYFAIGLIVLAVAGAVEAQYAVGSNYKQSGTWNVGGVLDIISGGSFKIGGTAITTSAAELNILDGVTATAAELNILDGVTATAAELNILDGVTATAAELNANDGQPTTFTISNAAESGNVITSTVTFKDANAVAVAMRVNAMGFLSGSSTCASELGTAPSTLGPTNGAQGYYIDLGATRKGQGFYVSNTAGVMVFSMKETGNNSFYLCLQMPTGAVVASSVIDFD